MNSTNGTFDNAYYPIIRTRMSELNGFKNLSIEQKNSILPVISLTHWRKKPGTDAPLNKLAEAFPDRPYILDVSKVRIFQNEEIRDLLNPKNHFANWKRLVLENANIIPVIQNPPASRRRDVMRQALEFEEAGKPIVFRVRFGEGLLNDAITTISAVSNPGQTLIIIDAQYIRQGETRRIHPHIADNIVSALNTIREDLPEAKIVVAGSSFPKSVLSFSNNSKKTNGTINILEHDLFEALGAEVAMYGDYASIHPNAGTGIMTTVPRIDYPSDEGWSFERRKEEHAKAYQQAAQALLESYPEIEYSEQWGNVMITNTAKASKESIKCAAANIAARVNIHISRQIAEQKGKTDTYNQDWL